MLNKFKVGDRVRAIKTVDGRDLTSKTGTILEIYNNNRYNIGVQFDTPFAGGHDLNQLGKYGYCRRGVASEFEFEIGDWDN